MLILPPDTHIWLTHRLQRDELLEHAAKAGAKGWLRPPIHFFSELPKLFGIREKPIGQLARRERISRIAQELGREFEMPAPTGHALVRGHMLDGLFGELLPEGVLPKTLETALARLDADDFARRRNAWLVSSYATYLARLKEDGLYDARQVHALIADGSTKANYQRP